jgi:hypothetical protein
MLYFTAQPDDIIQSTAIQDSYTLTPPKSIPFWAMVYSVDGHFEGRVRLTDGLLQLCETTETIANAAYIFGTYYKYSVRCFCVCFDLGAQCMHYSRRESVLKKN